MIRIVLTKTNEEMNKLIAVMTVLAISAANAHSHGPEHIQDIHKYITHQAWELVKAHYPGVHNSEMNRRIGDWQDGGLNGSGPWQKGKVVTGAFREDEEDVLYGYPFPYTSATHFWDADHGDNSVFNPPPHNRTYENAFRKLQSFWSGKDGYRDWLEIGPFFYNLIPYYIRVRFDSLHNAYKDHSKFLVTHWLDIGTGNWYAEVPPMPMIPFLVKNSNSYSYAEGEALAKRLCWEIVGRMCHLIEDSGVPAHAHNDLHLFGDYFESDFIPQNYGYYTWSSAYQQGGLVNINYKANPLRYIIYTTNQIADRFSSDDFGGDDNLIYPPQYQSENYLEHISPAYNYAALHNISFTTPPPGHAPVAAHTAFNYTIRAVAGFLWYVYTKFEIATDTPPDITGFTYNLPDQRLFTGETLEMTCNSTGNNLSYDWAVKVCDTNNLCNRNVQGLSVNYVGNTIRISNNYFRGNWTCTFYDSLCNGGGTEAEDPLHFFVGARVYNNAGSVRKFYRPERLTSINPIPRLRPGPFAGCPIVLTQDGMKFAAENNILHKSEFSENKDKFISDKLILKTIPAVNASDTSLTIALQENSVDISYFDNVRMFAIDHSANTEVVITDNGTPALIEVQKFSAPVYAEFEGTDVTELLGYEADGGKTLEGKQKEILIAKFDINKALTDTLAVVINAEPPDEVIPVVKDAGGILKMFDDSGNLISEEMRFGLRQSRCKILVPATDARNMTSLEMTWSRDFGISYLSVVPFTRAGMAMEEYAMKSAEDLLTGDVMGLLSSEDNNFAVLDSSTHLILKFKSVIRSVPQGMKRSYMLSATGRYTKPQGFDIGEAAIQFNVEDKKITETKILPNVPNPFNPETKVRITLAGDAEVELAVYDIAGRIVSRLSSGKLTKGEHQFIFDGSGKPSGAYFIRLSTGGHNYVRKMMLIK